MTDSNLRLQYLLIQPVYIFDNGEEFQAGPPVQPISLQPSEVAAFIESLPEVKAGVLAQMAEAEAKRAADLAENLTPAQIEEAAALADLPASRASSTKPSANTRQKQPKP